MWWALRYVEGRVGKYVFEPDGVFGPFQQEIDVKEFIKRAENIASLTIKPEQKWTYTKGYEVHNITEVPRWSINNIQV